MKEVLSQVISQKEKPFYLRSIYSYAFLPIIYYLLPITFFLFPFSHAKLLQINTIFADDKEYVCSS